MTATLTAPATVARHPDIRVQHDPLLGVGRCEWDCGRTMPLTRVTGHPRTTAETPVECVEVCPLCAPTVVAEALAQLAAHGVVTVEHGPALIPGPSCSWLRPAFDDADSRTTPCPYCQSPGRHYPTCPKG